MTARDQLREDTHALAVLIGVRAAARKMGISESTALGWAKRYQWKLPDVFRQGAQVKRAAGSNSITLARALEDTLKDMGEDTRLYLSTVALRAAYAGSQLSDKDLLGRDTAIALHNHAKTADIVHGYTQHAPTVAVQINVEKSEQIRARFAQDVAEMRALSR